MLLLDLLSLSAYLKEMGRELLESRYAEVGERERELREQQEAQKREQKELVDAKKRERREQEEAQKRERRRRDAELKATIKKMKEERANAPAATEESEK